MNDVTVALLGGVHSMESRRAQERSHKVDVVFILLSSTCHIARIATHKRLLLAVAKRQNESGRPRMTGEAHRPAQVIFHWAGLCVHSCIRSSGPSQSVRHARVKGALSVRRPTPGRVQQNKGKSRPE